MQEKNNVHFDNTDEISENRKDNKKIGHTTYQNKNIKSFEHFDRPQYQNLKKYNSQIQESQNKKIQYQLENSSDKYVENIYKRSYYAIKTKELIFIYINKKRQAIQKDQLFIDQTYNEFANQLINQDQCNYETMLANFKNFHDCKNDNIERINYQYNFQEDYENLENQNFSEFLSEMITLIEENKEDTKIMLSEDFNCLGLNVQYTDYCMKLEIILGQQKVQIHKMNFENQKLKLKGKIMQNNRGLYAIKVFDHKQDKQIAVINPQYIVFDNVQNFQVTYKFTQQIQNLPILQFYLNEDYSSIKYGKKNQQKYIPKSLEIEYTLPLISQFQQPEFQISSDLNQILNKPVNKSFRQSIRPQTNFQIPEVEISEQSQSEQTSQESLDLIESKQLQIPDSDQIAQQKQDQNLKIELEISIQEAHEDLIMQSRKNQELQQKLVVFQKESKKENEKQDDTLEINYYNVIGMIFNGQQDLEILNKEYTNIQKNLNKEIQTKQKQYEEICTNYQNFSQKILNLTKFQSKQQKQRFYDLSQQDKKLDKFLQDERVELARLKLKLKRKQLKHDRQEVLGQDIHLIDLEKLKIENQQLNEKIQSRTQEIFRLNKKNIQNIHILAHLEAKLSMNFQKVDELDKNFGQISIIKRKKIHKKQEINIQI